MSESESRPRPASSKVGDGEIETSGTEKVLALVLAIFIAIGAIWCYFKLDDAVGQDPVAYAPDRQLLEPAEFAALKADQRAGSAVRSAQRDRRAAIRELELSRETYRTALDAEEPAGALRVAYEQDQAQLLAVSGQLRAAAEVRERTGPAAEAAQAHLTELRRAEAKQANADRVEHDRIVFLLRLALLALMLAGAYRLLSRLRSRHSRYLPAALAWVGATAVLAAVMAADYADGYIAFDEVGPLAISIVGIALTLVAFIALQRFLAKRVPARRVRRSECPFCGFPVRDKPHCEGCGRSVIADCASCHRDRRVGTPRCGFCGAS